MANFQGKLYVALNNYLTEYKEKNDGNKYKPVAVGRYGIRTRESIYSKELAKDYSKNKVIFQNTLTVGMGSNQIDIGILDKDEIYSVSPAYHTYKISEINANYLRYCLECRNQDMFIRYVKRGSRQGKTIDLKRWLTYEIPVYDESTQQEIVSTLDKVSKIIENRKYQLDKLDELVKSRFIEMFGEGQYPKTTLINLIEDGAGLSYGIVQPGDDGTGDMGVLRPIDIVDGKISTKSIKYIDRSIGDGFKKTELAGDEILITVRGTTGITALTDSHFIGMNVTRGIAVIRYDCSKINPIYLNAYFNTEESQRYIQEHTRGATLRQINLSDLRAQEISVPPKFQQNQFADFVAQVDKSKLVAQRGAVGRFFHKRDSLHRIYLQ